MSMGNEISKDDYIPIRIWKRQELAFLRRYYRDIQYEREKEWNMSIEEIEELIEQDAIIDAARAIETETGIKVDPEDIDWEWR